MADAQLPVAADRDETPLGGIGKRLPVAVQRTLRRGVGLLVVIPGAAFQAAPQVVPIQMASVLGRPVRVELKGDSALGCECRRLNYGSPVSLKLSVLFVGALASGLQLADTSESITLGVGASIEVLGGTTRLAGTGAYLPSPTSDDFARLLWAVEFGPRLGGGDLVEIAPFGTLGVLTAYTRGSPRSDLAVGGGFRVAVGPPYGRSQAVFGGAYHRIVGSDPLVNPKALLDVFLGFRLRLGR